MTAKKKAGSAKKASETFSAEEKAAMKARARELKAAGKKAELLKALQEAIAEMPDDDRAIAERIHELVTTTAPDLTPKTWYGMPAYANADGKVVCFFQGAAKFDARYATFGFNDAANLDAGAMWATSFAVTKLTKTAEKDIVALVNRAVR